MKLYEICFIIVFDSIIPTICIGICGFCCLIQINASCQCAWIFAYYLGTVFSFDRMKSFHEIPCYIRCLFDSHL